MTFIEAAEAVLKTTKRAMTGAEIIEAAVRRGLITTRGKTPEATLSAALYRLVRDDPESPIQREYQQGSQRAVRGSVRWLYVR
jgi:HB1, ASXL, restriction endonuclease HTH domain